MKTINIASKDSMTVENLPQRLLYYMEAQRMFAKTRNNLGEERVCFNNVASIYLLLREHS